MGGCSDALDENMVLNNLDRLVLFKPF